MPETSIVPLGVAAIAAGLILRGVTAHRRRNPFGHKPQSAFKKVLADNTDAPFVHLSKTLTSLQSQHHPQTHPLADVAERLNTDSQRSLERCGSQPKFDTGDHFWYITREEELRAAAHQLSGAEVIGVDVEHNHLRSYRGMVCLLQLHADGRDYVIDVLELHDLLMDALQPIFANPRIIKVLHGGDNDVIWLQRDFRLYIANLFDTEKAALVLGKKERSLQSLLQEYAQVFQDKSHQLDDWRQRPLSQEMLDYAITDARYLPFLAQVLRRELQAEPGPSGDASLLEVAFQRSQAVASDLYQKTPAEEAAQASFASIWKRRKAMASGKAGQNTCADSIEVQQKRLAALCQWRDALARAHDEGVQHIVSNTMLWELASGKIQSERDAQIVFEAVLGSRKDSDPCFFSNRRERRLHVSELTQILLDPPEVAFDTHITIPAHQGKGSRLSRAEKRLLVAQKFSAKRQVYENCRMLSQAGELLCFCDMRKVRWYEAKGLGKRICNDPPTIQLTFEHKIGDQDLGQDAFYTASRDNRCVVCASKTHLLRYRVVPACYRKNFPVHQKSHRSHDVVLLCFNCHEAAQKSAEEVKRNIARDTGVPLTRPTPLGPDSQDLPPTYQVRHAAVALRAAGDRMPDTRRDALESLVRKYLHGTKATLRDRGVFGEPAFAASSLSLAELDEALLAGLGPKRRKQSLRRMKERNAKLQGAVEEGSESGTHGSATHTDLPDERKSNADPTAESAGGHAAEGHDSVEEQSTQEAGHMWHGRQVVEKLMERGGEDAVNAMIQRFRAAFVNATNPQHLPPFWQVDHNAVRQFGEYSVYKEGSRR